MNSFFLCPLLGMERGSQVGGILRISRDGDYSDGVNIKLPLPEKKKKTPKAASQRENVKKCMS